MESDEEDEEKMTQLVIAKRMFPATEVGRTFDEYGETIDPRQYMDDEQLELEAEVQKKADIAELEKDMHASEVLEISQPTKCSVETVDVRINCKVRYIDFEGRYDGNDLMNVLRYMRPHKMLIVHGDHASSEYLRLMCERRSGSTRAFAAPVACVDERGRLETAWVGRRRCSSRAMCLPRQRGRCSRQSTSPPTVSCARPRCRMRSTTRSISSTRRSTSTTLRTLTRWCLSAAATT